MGRFRDNKHTIRYRGKTYYQAEGRGECENNDIWYEDSRGNLLEVAGTKCRTETPWASAHEDDRRLFHQKVSALIKESSLTQQKHL